jgi:hypothetical protein
MSTSDASLTDRRGDAAEVERREAVRIGLAGIAGGFVSMLAQPSAAAAQGASGPTVLVPSARTADKLNKRLRAEMARPVPATHQEMQAALAAYRDRVLEDVTRPKAFVLASADELDKGVLATRLERASERITERTEKTLGKDIGGEARAAARLTPMQKAFVRGIAAITIGAIVGGPLGAAGGFVTACIGVLVEADL